MIKVDVEVESKLWFKKINNPNFYIKKKIYKFFKFIPYLRNKSIDFTILLTNSNKIKKLNKKFRRKNEATDVLSFPFYLKKNLKKINNDKIYLGDIAISYEIVNQRSKSSGFNLEFDKVWVHGFLHLLGHDHVKNKDYIKMYKIEKKIINSI